APDLVRGAAALVASGAAQAKNNGNWSWSVPPPPPWYQYAVPFTCGNNPSDFDRAVPGDYAFAVNVLNSSTAIAQLVKQVQLTDPPGGEQAGAVSSPIPEDLPGASAMQVSCAGILHEFVYAAGAPARRRPGLPGSKESLVPARRPT